MTVTRTSSLDAFGTKLKLFVDKLVAAYADPESKAKIDECTEDAFKANDARPIYDLIDYIFAITSELPEVYDATFTQELLGAFDDCIVSQYSSDFLMKKDWVVDCSVMLAVKGKYYGYVYSDEDPTQLEKYAIFYPDGKRELYSSPDAAEPEISTWKSTLADTYEQLAFDKATGWSRWLYLNEQIPCPYRPAEIHYPFPDDDEEEDL